ncbi:gliding motility protein RemB [Mucilaginibacter sp. ZB1P21]|uniref:Gliding motility protein RemB n=1 Tax=Mucilaginibacter glaciei TaxID=2772109 RepID=A0A926NSC8_9SPHI|nr:gliding motility protein RemB [Mucilaginibacter glaciei]
MLTLFLLILTAGLAKAQSVYLPQSYQFYQKFNGQIYSKGSLKHTSLRPFLIDSTVSTRYTELMNIGVDTTRKSWVSRKLFNEHLIQVNKKDFTFYGDFLSENIWGHDFDDPNTKPAYFHPIGVGPKAKLGLNTRGFQFGGTVGSKFSFYTSGYENQAVFPSYYNRYVDSLGFVPGQGYDRSFGKTTKDYSYVTALLSYTPIKELNITLGQDKTFIGDGYRSLLLSDFAANYPMLRVTANVSKFQYMMMWTMLQDINEKKFDSFGSNRRKYGLFHYLDYNVTNSLSLGFFNAVIIPEADVNGNRRGFDINYINPIVFIPGSGPSSQPANTMVGFTGKYKFLDKNAIYAQYLIDKLQSGSGGKNRTGLQLGARGGDIFGVKNLSYIMEYNTVQPDTYSDNQTLTYYTFYGQPLGHPLGANFKEYLGIMNYTAGRFDFQGQLTYSRYGYDGTVFDYGYNQSMRQYPAAVRFPLGPGVTTSVRYAEGTVSFMVNPKYNFRFELAGLYRDERNALGSKKTAMISFGLRTTFRNLYHDF